MPEAPATLQLVRAAPERAEEAISALLAAGPSTAARFARQAEAASVPLDRIWCLADDHGRYRLAVLAVPSLGRTAMLLASHAHSPAEAREIGRAVAAAAEGCADCCDIAQSLIEPIRGLDIEAFEAGGLQRIATLEYLERNLPRAGILESCSVPEGWRIEAASTSAALSGSDPLALGEDRRREIMSVLEASYRETLDCPGLAGLRRTGDVLDGHFGVGSRTRHWLVARRARDGADAGEQPAEGVCMLNAAPDNSTAELVYLGLAPEARGHGIARALLVEGLHRCSRSRIGAVSLAVDARNAPARALYESLGFRRVSSRVALVRSLSAGASRPA
ncbi:MAG: GNAT family N-acetyltransferase [Phycisphaerales bacterium]|jgi:ribosomal protein S18 acetylase RimI-like enzyme